MIGCCKYAAEILSRHSLQVELLTPNLYRIVTSDGRIVGSLCQYGVTNRGGDVLGEGSAVRIDLREHGILVNDLKSSRIR